jgi:hypothetical protein
LISAGISNGRKTFCRATAFHFPYLEQFSVKSTDKNTVTKNKKKQRLTEASSAAG